MILADANVWIDYFKSGDAQLQTFLANDQVVMHPCLAAELALGSLHNRPRTLAEARSNAPGAQWPISGTSVI